MMHVSSTELFVTYKAAFIAVGLTIGQAIDAERMALWLDRHGGDTARHLPGVLEDLAGPQSDQPTVSNCDHGVTIDCRNGSVLAVGPAAVDVAIAESRTSGVAKARLINARDLEFSGGLAAIVLAREAHAALSWRLPWMNVPSHLVVKGGEVFGTLPKARSTNRSTIEGEVALNFRPDCCRSMAGGLLRPLEQLLLDDAVWIQIQSVANDGLVPESDESRTLGAGIGADED